LRAWGTIAIVRARPAKNIARCEGSTLWGGQMRVPVPGWPGQRVRGPLGLSLYLTAADARKLNRPSQTRSVLARAIVDCIAAQRPTRRIRGLSEGGYATTEGLQPLPASVEVGSRRLLTGKLSAPPLPRATARRGGATQERRSGGERRNPWRVNGLAGSLIPPKPRRSSRRGRDGGRPCCRDDCAGWWWYAGPNCSVPASSASASRRPP
jgi:hypothetical protein